MWNSTPEKYVLSLSLSPKNKSIISVASQGLNITQSVASQGLNITQSVASQGLNLTQSVANAGMDAVQEFVETWEQDSKGFYFFFFNGH